MPLSGGIISSQEGNTELTCQLSVPPPLLVIFKIIVSFEDPNERNLGLISIDGGKEIFEREQLSTLRILCPIEPKGFSR